MDATAGTNIKRLGRYEMHGLLASGGMAAVHLGRLRGDAGFARPVAIKRLHAQFANDPEFVAMLLDEAKLASRLHHPNCVGPRDVVVQDGEVFVVMDYVHGLTLAGLVRSARDAGRSFPIRVVSRILLDVLMGLDAAHRAEDEQGRALELVHRDVSPQNVIVGADGMSRVIDFGIAQAAFRSQTTREGQMKGKLAYAAPEQIVDDGVTHLVDIYASAVVCWELIAMERLFSASNATALFARVIENQIRPLRPLRVEVSEELETLILNALAKDQSRRPQSAEAFARLLEKAAPPASHREVAQFLEQNASATLLERASAVRAVEQHRASFRPPVAPAATAPVASSAVPALEPEEETLTIAGASRTASEPAPQSLTRGQRLRRVATVAITAVTGLLLLGLAFAPRGRANPANTSGSPTVASAAGPPAQVVAERQVPAELQPVPSGLAMPAPVSSAVPSAPSSKSRRLGSSPTHPATAAPDCASLYAVDSSGIRRVKRECLRKLSQP